MSLPNAAEGTVVFRIFTQWFPEYSQVVIDILRNHGFLDYTFVQGRGYGPHQIDPEDSFVVDVAVEDYDASVQKRMVAAVKEICEKNGPRREERSEGGQGSVLLIRIPADIQFISREAGYVRPKPIPFWGPKSRRSEPDYRGVILFEAGDWKKLLKAFGIAKRGRVLGFFQTEAPKQRSFSAFS
jgi:hypothetical protein